MLVTYYSVFNSAFIYLGFFHDYLFFIFKTRVVGAAAYLLLALMDHFEIDVGPPSSDLERPFEP